MHDAEDLLAVARPIVRAAVELVVAGSFPQSERTPEKVAKVTETMNRLVKAVTDADAAEILDLLDEDRIPPKIQAHIRTLRAAFLDAQARSDARKG